MNIRCLADIDFAASPIYSAILMLKACMHKTRMLGRGGWERSEYRLGTDLLRFALLRFASFRFASLRFAKPRGLRVRLPESEQWSRETSYGKCDGYVWGLAGAERRTC